EGSNSFNQVAAPGTVTSVASGISALNSRGNEGLPYFMTGGANDITGFVGYANSGASFTNGEGFAVKGALTAGTSTEGPLQDPSKHYGNLNKYTSIVTKGSFVDAHAGAITAPYAGVGASVNTSDPTLANAVGGGHADLQLWLPAGWYVMAGGGSCADFTCTATAATSSQYAFKILPNAAVSAPVPVPAAVWLFGSALAGMGAIGRRKQQMT
ncbi:MAG: hypothetical protein H6R26_3346, partial [Proteobacteria bacterium]|nr:hypothetical protein [Pseudomonadota bacterium]